MKIVLLERNSAGTDVPVDCFYELGEVTSYPNTVTIEEVAERVGDADVVVCNKAPMREESLKNCPNVKLICELATGYDNCDLEYCKSRGIKVANVVDYSTAMVAQHTFTLALALSQKLPYYDEYVKSGAYSAQDRFSNFDRPFYELEGKTWGIVGMGNIGKRAAAIATAFGCKVIFYSITGKSTCTDYPQVDKDTLLRESDFLSLHCPLSDLSRNFIDKEAFRKMKKTAVPFSMPFAALTTGICGSMQAATCVNTSRKVCAGTVSSSRSLPCTASCRSSVNCSASGSVTSGR